MRSGCRNKGQEIRFPEGDAGWKMKAKCSVRAMCYWDQTGWGENTPERSYAKRPVSSSLSILSKLTLFHFLSAIVRKPSPHPSNKSMVSKSGNLFMIFGYRFQPKSCQASTTFIRIRSTEPMSPVGLGQNSPIAQDAASLDCLWQQPGRRILDNHLLDVPDVKDVSLGKFAEFQWMFFTGWYFFLNMNFVLRILMYVCGEVTTTALPIIIRKKLSWNNIYQHLQMWSVLHTFQDRCPGIGCMWSDKGTEWGGREKAGGGTDQAIFLAKRA